MADRKYDRLERLRPYSRRFEQFIDNELEGDVSDLDISDDEDADPDFEPGEPILLAHQHSSSDEDDDEGQNLLALRRISTDSSDPSSCPVAPPEVPVNKEAIQLNQPGQSVSGQRRVYWKKQVSFNPLPAAPQYEGRQLNAMNLPAQDYVSKYIPDDIFHTITEMTNRAYVENKGRSLISDVEQTRRFFGSALKMSIMGLPCTRMYYDSKTKVPSIASIVPRDKFFAIRNNIKLVNDNEVPQAEKDASKFWKVGPIVKSVRTGCLLNDRSPNVSIDEQMVPFWGRVPGRQVIKSKPNPCGVKIFVAAAPNGLPLDIFFYNGKGDTIVDDPIFSGLTIRGKAVIKLLSTFSKECSVYMDRYFTSVELLDFLHSERESSGTGTLQKQRVPTDSKLKEDREMKREGRGSIDQSVRCDGQISVVKWFDNKAVLLISNKEGVEPVDKCRRWCKTRRVFLDVDRPFIVKQYNTHMGVVDFLDRVISYYRISARTRKWPIRVLMHFFYFSIAAGWIEYWRDQCALGTAKKDIIDLKGFKEEYAEFLVYGGVQESTEDSDDPDYRCSLPAARKWPSVAHPSDQLRTRNVLHMPETAGPTKKNRCRFPGCSSNGARVRCTSCQVYLCLQENRNCFKAYHEL